MKEKENPKIRITKKKERENFTIKENFIVEKFFSNLK